MWLHCKYAANFQGRQIVFIKERLIDKSKLDTKHQTNPGIKASWIQNTKLTQGMTQPGRPYIQLKEPHSFTKTIKFVAQKINHVPRSTLNGNHTGKCFIVALFVIHVASFMHPPPPFSLFLTLWERSLGQRIVGQFF